MALTPEDVVNKRFQPTKFREGYDQDEVDDFLDEVVVELRRLNQENEELRQRLIASDSRINDLQRSASQGPASIAAPAPAAAPSFTAQPEQYSQPEQFAQPAAPVAAPVPTPAPAAAAYPGQSSDSLDPNNTNNLLQLARRLHEEHVREGVEKRDALIAEGHEAAARIVAESEAAQREQIGALDEQRQKLEQETQQLEQKIDELRTFEREYRQKLKSYIEGQLRELDSSAVLAGGAAPQQQAYSAPEQQPAPNFTGFAGAN